MPSSGVNFTSEVANPDQPQGQVAARLRELVSTSSIKSSTELKRLSNYAGSTLSEAMSGRRRQNRNVITKIVQACVPDTAAADTEIDRLVTVLEQEPETPESSAAEQVVERAPDPAKLAGAATVGDGGLVEKPLDEDDDEGIDEGRPPPPAADARGSHIPPLTSMHRERGRRGRERDRADRRVESRRFWLTLIVSIISVSIAVASLVVALFRQPAPASVPSSPPPSVVVNTPSP